MQRMELKSQCKACSYYKIANYQVGGEIVDERNKPDIMIIGEAPGPQEDIQNRPFIGPSGQLLREALEDILPRSFITNTVKCYPHGTPSIENARICVTTHLIRQIVEIEPKLIILVGNVAEDRFPRSVYSGKLVKIPHPAWALRGGAARRDNWKKVVREMINEVLPSLTFDVRIEPKPFRIYKS